MNVQGVGRGIAAVGKLQVSHLSSRISIALGGNSMLQKGEVVDSTPSLGFYLDSPRQRHQWADSHCGKSENHVFGLS